MRILLDVMGGDLPPQELIRGGIAAARNQSIDIAFAGDARTIEATLAEAGERSGERFSIVPSTDVISMDDPPVRAIREKKGSSLVVGLAALHRGEVDGFVSPGNTGAVVVGSIFTLGRIAAIPRPGLLAVLPTLRGPNLLVVDVGANTDCSPSHLAAFALMGATYAREILRIEHPRVGLLNIGTEETKGNRITQEAFALLRTSALDFAGNVEPHHLLTDRPVDVVVCDGFIGNVFLKSIEGGISAVTSLLKRSIIQNAFAKVGALLLKRAFSDVRQVLSYERHGGAPLLGVNGTVVIAHGRSDAVAIESAVDVARRQVEARLVERFGRGMQGWARDGG
ncbi:MAG: phosphate acyltransferase PlsX [Candidatus Bipolaricaulis sp.]|nr:phosphate acyltransferase PlsX [Candidatus Bipolaricaulis sp.]